MPSETLDLDAYLARIGYLGPHTTSVEVLRALHRAHVGAVPFENLDLLLGKGIALDLAALQTKLVTDRRGGYCFEQNTLFRAVLEALGFAVVSLAARVRAPDGRIRPHTHMLLRVDLPEGPFLADVGFGGDGPVHALPLVAGPESWTFGTACRLRREDELWVLEGNLAGEWLDLYAFTLEPQYPVDFEMANHFTSTFPSSPFLQNLVVQRTWPEKRAILRNRELVLREGGAAEKTTIRDPEHLLEVLDHVFGLRFPPGTRFAQPSFA